MDTKIFKISSLRVVDANKLTEKLSEEKKKEAIEYYKDKEKLYYVDVSYINNLYVVTGKPEYFYAMKQLRVREINVAIKINELDKIKDALILRVKNERLNPILSAYIYQEIKKIGKLNQSKLSEIIGKTQGAISNKTRLLRLPIQVQLSLLQGVIKERHGRSILLLESEESFEIKAIYVLNETINNNLKVDETEDLVYKLLGREVKKRENLYMTKLTKQNRLKHNEVQPIIKHITAEMEQVQMELKEKFPGLKFELDEGINKGDYVFLLKMKGVNE